MTEYPARPDHPDFWTLAQIVIDNDAISDNHTIPFSDRVGRVIDPDTVRYMSGQRALRVRKGHARFVSHELRYGAVNELDAMLAGAWIDGFMAGAAYQAERAQHATPAHLNGEPPGQHADTPE